MMDQQFFYPYEKIRQALRMLTSLSMTDIERLQAAMLEFGVAYGQGGRPIPEGAERDVELLRSRYLQGPPGDWGQLVSTLGEEDLDRLAEAFLGLYEALTRAYHSNPPEGGRRASG